MAIKLFKRKKTEEKKVEAVKETVEEKHYANLNEVMDYTLPFELIFSGVENEAFFRTLSECGVKNFLMSYHYVQTHHINMKERFGGKGIRLFIDSGAYTYMTDPKYAERSVEEWEEQLKKYLRWAERNKEYIFAIANFDFEIFLDPEIVDRWNREYFEPFMLKTGIPVCFVWHNETYRTFDFYCQRYPYVGFSAVTSDSTEVNFNNFKKWMNIAEKHNTLIHGFGLTRTRLLTQLPFYTSDSTTWTVGMQYGEMNFWNGTAMQRLKKEKWKNDMIDVIVNKYGLDKEKLLEEDLAEMNKANVYAFMEAEKFIQERLKSKMYWLKAKTQKIDLTKINPLEYFPDPQKLYDYQYSYDELKEFAQKLNINPELPEVGDIIYACTAFVNWDNEDFKVLKDSYCTEEGKKLIPVLHDFYINRVVASDDERITDLIHFFREVVTGETDKLLLMGTNFDRQVKERDQYIEDELDEEEVEISADQVREKVAGYLPEKEAPDLEALDREIFDDLKIKPVYDERTRKLLKGKMLVKTPKKVYTKKYPKFACDTCYAASNCPEYKAGYACAYSKLFNRFSSRNMQDIIEAMQGMVDHNMSRMQRAMVIEAVTGVVDPQIPALINQNTRLLANLRDIYMNTGGRTVVSRTHVINPDGTQEVTSSIETPNVNPQQGSILAKLFEMGGSDEKKEKQAEAEIIEAEKGDVKE